MEENKPLDTDSAEDETNEDAHVESDSSESDPSLQQAEGKEDVSTNEDLLATIEETSGRKFKDSDDFVKHYQNMASLVGKKVETPNEETPKESEAPKEDTPQNSPDISKVVERLDKSDFLSENPDAKEHFDSIIKPLSAAKGLSLGDAWEEFKPFIEASKANENAKEIGVNSKNRIAPTSRTEMNKMANSARSGNAESQELLVDSLLKSGK